MRTDYEPEVARFIRLFESLIRSEPYLTHDAAFNIAKRWGLRRPKSAIGRIRNRCAIEEAQEYVQKRIGETQKDANKTRLSGALKILLSGARARQTGNKNPRQV